MVLDNIIIRTVVPILLLIGTGFSSRKIRVLKQGDERVLSSYIYYFALPALFFVNLAETSFTAETLRFISAGILPLIFVLAVYGALFLVFRFPKKTLYLLILTTLFGSLAFFGIPFIIYAFPTEGEQLATLSAASISFVSVTISITILELYRLDETSVWEGVKKVSKRLSKNPLILSILLGILVSISGLEVPAPISQSLHMLGGTTSTVAIFMLGVFLYGRKYVNIRTAFKLSLLRIVFLPTIAYFTTMFFNLPSIPERSTLVLMHGMPVAISMIVLSERYDFYKETIASLILISSLAAGLYLNIWLLILLNV